MRIFGIRKAALLGVVASTALMLTPTTTLATSGTAGVAEGSGTISPALTTTDQTVSGGFSGTLVAAGAIGTTPTVIDDSCTFTFNSAAPGDSIATGQGTASGTCSGTASVTASLTYTRVGAAVAITGTGTVNGTATSVEVVCEFIPTSNPPSFVSATRNFGR